MVIETFTFRLAEGAEESAFLEANERVQTDFVYSQPGLLRRTTARGEDGEWLIVVLWRSQEDVEASASRAQQDPAVRTFGAHIDHASVRLSRYSTLD